MIVKLALALGLSVNVFNITGDVEHGLLVGKAQNGVQYLLDDKYNKGDDVLVIYKNDNILYEKELD